MNVEIGFRYCQSIDGGFAAWTHDQDTLFLAQGETIPALEKSLDGALAMGVAMGLSRRAPLVVHLSRSDSGGSVSLVGSRGEALLDPFVQDPSRRFESEAFVGVRLVTPHLHVVAPRGPLKPELLGHLVHALREQQDSRVDPPWDAFLEAWLAKVKSRG